MPAGALQKIRAQYPQYADIPDHILAQRILAKYPQYADLLGDVARPAPVVAAPSTDVRETPEAIAAQQSIAAVRGRAAQPTLRQFGRYWRQPAAFTEIASQRTFALPRFIEAPLQYTVGQKAAEAVFGGGPLLGPTGAGARSAATATGEVTRHVGTRLAPLTQRFRPTMTAPIVEPPPPITPSLVAREPMRIENITPTRPLTEAERTAARQFRLGEGMIPVGEISREAVGTEQARFAEAHLRLIHRQARIQLQQIPDAPNIGAQAPPPDLSQKVMFPIGGGGGAQTVRVTQTPRVILNRVFGENVGDNVVLSGDVGAQILGPRNVGLRQAGLMRLSDAEDRNLFQVLEGRAQPITQRVADIAAQFRQIATEDAGDYVRLGARVMVAPRVTDPQTGRILRPITFKPFEPIQNYAPRKIDPNRVMDMPLPRLASELQQTNTWLTPQQAADAATVLRSVASGTPIPGNVSDEIVTLVRGQSFLPSHLHARGRLVLSDSILRSMREAIPDYIEDAARERAFLRTFGAQADEQIDQAIQQLGPRDYQVRLAAEVWDVYRGRFIESETGRRAKQTAHILNNLATATLLGFQTAISQVSQFAALVGRLGVPNVIRGLGRVVVRGGKIEAERAGTFVNSLTDEFVRALRMPPTATAADVLERQSARFAGGVIRLAGIKAMDEFPRAVGFHAAQIAINDAVRAANLGNGVAMRMLAEVGLTPAATADEIVRTAASLSRHLNVTANFADLPFVLQTPIGAFARGLNTFNIQVTRMVNAEFIQPALRWVRTGGRSGSISRLLRFTGSSLVLGEAIGETRRAVTGRMGDRPGGTTTEFVSDLLAGRVPPRIVVKRAIDALGWAGTLGLLQNVWQSMQFALSPQEAGARGAGVLLGAGISSASEVTLGTGTALGRALTGPTPESRARGLRTAGRIGVRRIPLVGGIVAPRIFRSETADRRTAVQAVARALLRGDTQTAEQIIGEFSQRHGSTISQESIDKAILELRR